MRTTRRSWGWTLPITAVVALLPLIAFTAPPPDRGNGRGPLDKVDRSVLEQAVGKNEVTYWVILRDRADLSGAPAIRNWEARGRHVVGRLQGTARRSQAELRRFLEDRGVRHRPFWIVNTVQVRSGRETLEQIAAMGEVETIVPEKQYAIPPPIPASTETPILTVEWNIARIRADAVWSQYGTTGQGIIVANVDTGVDYTHQALVNQYRGNLGGGVFDHNYNWWDPSQICGVPGSPPCDNNSHGTHTMGTIVGGDAGGPFTSDIGVAPGARWIAAKGCESNFCSDFALLSSGQWIAAPTDMFGQNERSDLRPHVVNNSWGGGGGNPFYDQIVGAWRMAGIVPIFSNGNAGPGCGSAGSPGDFPNTFGAGATDINDFIAGFSSRGPSLFGGIKPDASAPGVSVRSSIPGNGYASFSGTSMAAPHVTGMIALLWSAAPSLIGDIDQTFRLIKDTAVDRIDFQCGGDPSGDPNNVYGEGRIDALAAVQAAPRTTGTLQGLVTDAATAAPIAGASVRSVRQDDGLIRATTTNGAGAYSVLLPIDPAPGPELYDVTLSLFGYQDRSYPGVALTENTPTTLNASLTSLPRFTISGTVRDETGEPIPGAMVDVLGTPIPPATTDAAGTYAIPGVPQGEYDVRASVGRCNNPQSSHVVLNADAVVDFQLPARRDAFGYGCRIIPIDWADATTILPLGGDDASTEVVLPFTFTFYGRDYTSAHVATNGFLNFLGPDTNFTNSPIPDPTLPNGAIYAMWDDLYFVDGESLARTDLYGAAPDRVFVIEWENIGFYADPGNRVNFEVKLYERGGSIELLYRSMPGLGDGQSATLGIESPEGVDAFQYSFDEAVVSDGLAIHFAVGPLTPQPILIGTTNQGELVDIDMRTRVVRLIGDAGQFEGRDLGWTDLAFDDVNALYAVSRPQSELPTGECELGWFPSNCSHLYQISPFSGSIIRHVGSTHQTFVSDIDFGGALLANFFINDQQTGRAALGTLDRSTGNMTVVGLFDEVNGAENGGLAVDPDSGRVWGVENTVSLEPSLFEINPATGQMIAGSKVRLGLNGQPTSFGMDALIIAAGRFVSLQGGTGDMWEIRPTPDPTSGLAEITFVPLSLPGLFGKLNGLEIMPVLPTGFAEGMVRDAIDGRPVQDATVLAVEAGVSAATDSAGFYRLRLPVGTHTLEASHQSYATERATVAIVEGMVTTHDFVMRSPAAQIAPPALQFVALTGVQRSKILTVRNTGQADLNFTIDEATVPAAATNVEPLPAGVDTRAPAAGYAPRTVDRLLVGGPVLVFMDFLPWGSDALLRVLVANGIGYDLVDSSQMGTINLSPYEVVFISSDQTQFFYDNYNANLQRFVDYTQAGGFLWFGAAAWGWNGGNADGLVLPGGMTVRGPVFETFNDVLDPSHPTMQGVPNPFSGTGTSHAAFDGIPNGANVIARGNGSLLPTLVEYPFGDGRVLAFGQTMEFGFVYGQDAGRILENGVPYAYLFEPVLDIPWLRENPAGGTVAPGGSLDVSVTVDTTGLAPGLYRARLVFDTNDPRNPRIQVPVTLVVTTFQNGVNVGGKAYTDTTGDRWVADQAYATGGFGFTNKRSRTAATNSDITGTVDDPLYQNLRTDPGEYRFDGLVPGVYQVELKFAELKQSNTGTRLADVIVEGALVLPAHDIVLDAGSKAADDHSFFVAVTDGQMSVRFVGRRGYAPPIINALRVTLRPDR